MRWTLIYHDGGMNLYWGILYSLQFRVEIWMEYSLSNSYEHWIHEIMLLMLMLMWIRYIIRLLQSTESPKKCFTKLKEFPITWGVSEVSWQRWTGIFPSYCCTGSSSRLAVYICTLCVCVLGFLPQELSLALQAVQRLNLAVHVPDFLFQVLPRDIHLLAKLGEHSS